jgi:ParB-like chromosome segregation protein Spo0J
MALTHSQLSLDGAGFENPRTDSGLDGTSIKELADDIESRGLLHPLTIWPTVGDDGVTRHVVIDGQRRYLAIRRLIEDGNWPADRPVPHRLYPAPTIGEAREAALASALHRQDLSTYEIAVALAKLEGTPAEIAARVGKSRDYVYFLLRVHKHVSDESRGRGRAGAITAADAYEEIRKRRPVADQVVETAYRTLNAGMSTGMGATAFAKRSIELEAPDEEEDPQRERPKLPALRRLRNRLVKQASPNDYAAGALDMLRFVLGEPAGRVDTLVRKALK